MRDYANIRLEIVKLARDYLVEKYTLGQMTHYPTIQEILEEAEKFDNFVS
jgi:hypothetical protein